MKCNLKNQAIAMVLVASQLSLIPWTNYASAADVSSTPEIQLLTSAMVAQSMNLSQEDLQKSIVSAVGDYEKSAPLSGREDRMVDALVTMKFMTPARAQSFRASVDSTVQSQVSSGASLKDQTLVNKAIQSALSHDQGAQFSACDAGMTAMGIGALGAFVGLLLAAYNPTCSTPTYSTYYSDGSSAVTYGPTTCTSDYHPDAKAGDQTMIYSGAVFGIGALIYLFTQDNWFCE